MPRRYNGPRHPARPNDRDLDRLLDLERAPQLPLAHPTLEHLLPLLVALGAATDHDPVSFPIEGFEFGSLSRTSVQFGQGSRERACAQSEVL